MSQAADATHAHAPTSTGIEHKKLIMWLFLASDCMFFGTLISTHLLYRKLYPTGFTDAEGHQQFIQKLFNMAHGQNLPLLQTSHLELQVLVDVISHKDVVAIVLLDNVVLRNLPSSEYSGHYVILCGISYDEDLIHYAQLNCPDENDNTPNDDFCIAIKNPGSWKHVEYITPSIFEKAWRARGTDEDVIFIAKQVQGMDCIK